MGVKPGYKQTELGVSPQDWKVTRLGDVLRFQVGYPFSSSFFNEKVQGVRLVRNRDLKSNDQIVYYSGSYDPSFVVRDGDVLVGMDGDFLPCRWVKGPALLNQRVGRIFPLAGLNAEFAFYFLLGPLKEIEVATASTTVKHLSHGDIVGIEKPLPTIPEQRAIAEALSDVDALLAGLDRLIAKKRDLKQAAMQQLLTGQTRLPGFSGAWEVKRLGEIAMLNRMNVVPALLPEESFVHFSLPAFDAGKSAQIESGKSIGSNKFRIPPTAVLVSKLNPRIPRIWAPPSIPENAVASTEWLVLTPREGLDRQYLYVLCSSTSFCEQMELAATGTTGSHQRISPGTAMDIWINVATDQDEQTAIAAVLSDMDAELAALEARRDKTRDLKQGMMQELLTGRTRLI